MRARLNGWLQWARDTFWLVPAALVLLGLLLGESLVAVEQHGLVSPWLLNGWLYGGGESGARTLLGAIASSSIGVAGTLFSITIASLALASSQMGPRLLHNFMRDRGNQITLGLFLGVFAYAIMVLRSVRGADEGHFVPHLAVTIAVGLALCCVGALVFFVHHAASRINVDVVVELVHDDLCKRLHRLTSETPPPGTGEPFSPALTVAHAKQGYLQAIDEGALAAWAAKHGTRLRLHAKPGDYIFPGRPVLDSRLDLPGLDGLLEGATRLGPRREAADDPEFNVRQLVDVAVRALSPGINDPQTAISVLDRLGAALCTIAGRHLPSGVRLHDGEPRFQRDAADYAALTDAMFHAIRQNAASSAPVLLHLIEVLTAVAEVERAPERLTALQRHGRLAGDDGQRAIGNAADRADLSHRLRRIAEAIQPQ